VTQVASPLPPVTVTAPGLVKTVTVNAPARTVTVTKTVGVKAAKKVKVKAKAKAKACARGFKRYHGRCVRAVYGKG
jgi:hypothetical protein